MFPTWRIKLREAKEAFQQGRLDEANALLDADLREYLPAKKLSAKVAREMAQRARQRIAAGETSAGWRDLKQAEDLAGGSRDVDAIRDELLEKNMLTLQRLLAAGEAGAALKQLAKMERRGRLTTAVKCFQDVARHVHESQQLADRGRFMQASHSLRHAQPLLPEETDDGVNGYIQQRIDKLDEHAEQFSELNQRLHRSLMHQDWTAVLADAEAILQIASQCSAAQQARKKAWDVVGLKTTQTRGRKAQDWPVVGEQPMMAQRTHTPSISDKGDTVGEVVKGDRMILWVDGVGGFLVTNSDEIVIGQPSANDDVDLPILADLSRRHAVIRREGGTYVLEPFHNSFVDEKAVSGPTVLADGNVITLGDNVRLRFRKPHALSASARIDIESNHKSQPRADGVLLMAESVVLGPKSHSHVRCRDWQKDVILFRRSDTLHCRTSGKMDIDGEEYEDHGPVAVGSQIEGEDFSLSLEQA